MVIDKVHFHGWISLETSLPPSLPQVGDLGDSLKNSLGLGGSDDVLDKIADMDRDKYCVKVTIHCDTVVESSIAYWPIYWISESVTLDLTQDFLYFSYSSVQFS